MIGQAYEEKAYAGERYPEQPKQRGGYTQESYGRVETPRKGIADELQTLRELISATHEYMTMLEQKTTSFRRMTPQCEAKEQKVPRQYGSELTEELSAQNERLQALCTRMSIVIEEIDL